MPSTDARREVFHIHADPVFMRVLLYSYCFHIRIVGHVMRGKMIAARANSTKLAKRPNEPFTGQQRPKLSGNCSGVIVGGPNVNLVCRVWRTPSREW